ncbi:hypothetical protein PIB30_085143, partial [Stylosanthes scabra]|nr:hypothetical protein [Stylosanthes scabra]
ALAVAATSSIEEVASSTASGILFFQITIFKDRNFVTQLIRRAEKAGFKALIVTVDYPFLGHREAEIKNRFALPENLALKKDNDDDSATYSYIHDQLDPSMSWKDIKWLQTITSLPILVKGILTAEDARIAVENGVSGIIVSNHGARQLDYVPPTIMVLEQIVRAVEGRVPVFLDGGIRRGTDVFKALALGASAVLIGRPVVFSLAVEGEVGVTNVLKMLRDELQLTMALCGCSSLESITRNHIFNQILSTL